MTLGHVLNYYCHFDICKKDTAVVKMVLLVFLLTLLTGACPLKLQEEYVKAGEMATLYCGDVQCDEGDKVTLWKKDNDQETYLYSNMSAEEHQEMGVLVFGNCLIILNASVNHHGNYSCDSYGTQIWFMVIVSTSQSKEYGERSQYPITCYTKSSCTLRCPHDLAEEIPSITSGNVTWYKDDEPAAFYFENVEEKDSGVYTCTRSYLYYGQTHKITFTVLLTLKQEANLELSKITSPQDNYVFQAELGKKVVIYCEAITDTCNNLLFWLSNNLFVDEHASARIFFSVTCNNDAKSMRATLVFKEVLEEDLSKNYTCKLQCDDQPAQLVTITLNQKDHLSYTSLAVCVVIIAVVVVMMIVFYVKFKDGAMLLLSNTLDRRRNPSALQILDQHPSC